MDPLVSPEVMRTPMPWGSAFAVACIPLAAQLIEAVRGGDLYGCDPASADFLEWRPI